MFSERTNWKLSLNRFTEALDAARAGGEKILDLTASNPTRVGLEYDSATILGALASPRALDYDPQSKGLLAARQSICAYYREEHSIPATNPERIILTTSTSEGYSFVFRLLCNAKDELLVPKPSYPLFEFLADLQDVKLVPYPLIYDHGWQMDFASLEKAVTSRTRGVVVVNPNNPTGSYVQDSESRQLHEFCKSHELAIVADEVFLDYAVDGQRHRSLASEGAALTFSLSGLSKISALPQMKVAWIVTSGPKALVQEAVGRLEVIADTYLSMNAPIQWAVPALLEQRKSIQHKLLERVRGNLAELDKQLSGQSLCQRLQVQGGWYAVIRVPVTQTDEELAVELIQKESLLVHPGHFYDFPQDGFLILSLINPPDEFSEGVRRLLNHLDQ